jgi:hypothetical protein
VDGSPSEALTEEGENTVGEGQDGSVYGDAAYAQRWVVDM